jgi:AraC-like DNA-binding protein
MVLLNGIVVFNIFVLAILLLFRKNNTLPNKVLAFIFIIPGLNFINNILILNGNVYQYPFFYFVVQATAVLFAPFVYYYILLLIGKKIQWQKILFLISIALFFYCVSMAVDFLLSDDSSQFNYIEAVLNGPYPENMELYSFLFFILQLIYLSFGVLSIYKYKQNIQNNIADIELSKLKYLTNFIVLLWSLTFLTIVFYAVIPIIYVEYIILPIIISIVNVFILYYAFHYNAVFSISQYKKHLQNAILINTDEEIENEKLQFPIDLPDKIQDCLSDKKIYKDPQLTLQKLALELNVPSYQVSKAINMGLGLSFYDLINKKRVEEACKLLSAKNQNNFSIEGIAYESGFNSRTAFYRAIKKYLNKNPSDLVF